MLENFDLDSSPHLGWGSHHGKHCIVMEVEDGLWKVIYESDSEAEAQKEYKAIVEKIKLSVGEANKQNAVYQIAKNTAMDERYYTLRGAKFCWDDKVNTDFWNAVEARDWHKVLTFLFKIGLKEEVLECLL